MLSTCPSCLNQILHDDGAEMIRCECGEAFTPFLTMPPVMELNSNSSLMTMSEKIPPFTDYSESEAAFAELRNFGEGIGAIDSQISEIAQEPTPLQPPVSETGNGQPTPPNFSSPTAQHPAETGGCLITAGDSLSGFEIDSFLSPLSIWCSASVDSEDPLKQAHEIISQRAIKLGANGVVSVRWSFTPDGSRILLTGTPVKCRKQS